MTLVREILNDATDAKVDIATVLRKCKILAARLKSRELAEWVDRELNGYPDSAGLPEYRISKISAKAHLVDKWRRAELPGAAVMSTQIPERFRVWAEKAYLVLPISGYASLLTGDQEGEFASDWPQELAVKFGGAGYSDEFQCIKAWQVIPRATIVGLIDTVRNRIIEFLLQIDEASPDAGEKSSEELPPERVGQIFNITISGGTSNIAAGSTHVTQSQSGVVQAGDWKSLVSSLESLGVEGGSITELKDNLAKHGASKETVRGWLGTLAMSGVTTLATDGVKHAAEAIAAYMGWK